MRGMDGRGPRIADGEGERWVGEDVLQVTGRSKAGGNGGRERCSRHSDSFPSGVHHLVVTLICCDVSFSS